LRQIIKETVAKCDALGGMIGGAIIGGAIGGAATGRAGGAAVGAVIRGATGAAIGTEAERRRAATVAISLAAMCASSVANCY